MANAVGARTQGDDYQARIFWLNACRLLRPKSHVVRVAYENNETQFFDDVAVYYDCDFAIERGEFCNSDHYQVKFHVDHSGRFTYESLTNPAFLGVKEKSLLQRVHNFIEKHPEPCRIYVVAPWGIQDQDPLGKLLSNTGGEIRLRQLSSDTMRKVREHWLEHLGLSDHDALIRCLRPLRIEVNSATLEGLRRDLNVHLHSVGLETVDESHHTNPYDDLIRKLHQGGKTSFTKDELIDLCKKEGLWAGSNPESSGRRIGIRSFMRWAEHMEEQTVKLLSLNDLFDERAILDECSWNEEIPKRMEEFVDGLETNVHYELRLDSHSSLAFAAGYCLNPKRGIDVAIVQRILGREVIWKPSLDTPSTNPDDVWKIEEVVLHEEQPDVAIVLNVTQNATADVAAIATTIPTIGRLLQFTVLPGIGSTSVKDANHCLQLAQAVSAVVRQQKKFRGDLRLHIFGAAPNALMFMLGQHSQGFGAMVLYEYDFDSSALGAYKPSIRFPFSKG
jgi:SMODS-associated and fused to various effectors sensor domain